MKGYFAVLLVAGLVGFAVAQTTTAPTSAAPTTDSPSGVVPGGVYLAPGSCPANASYEWTNAFTSDTLVLCLPCNPAGGSWDATNQVCVCNHGDWIGRMCQYNLAELVSLHEQANTADGNMDRLWLLIGAFMVFLMQAGFALLEVGSVRAKNARNILMKNFLDLAIGALSFWLFGWAFAYGVPSDSEGNGFIGFGDFGLVDFTDYAGWFFQFAFAATAATIVSGSVAERIQFRAYVVYSIIITGLIYPIVVHWGWSTEGFLSAFRTLGGGPAVGETGMIDFAGSGIVHTCGGFAGLAGAIVVGPRLKRFEKDGTVNPMPGHNSAMAALGTFILIWGWFGFNAGSTLAFSGTAGALAAKVCVTTILAASSAALTTVVIVRIVYGSYDLINALNGALAGLVAITSGCAVVEPWAAVVIGMCAAPIFLGAAALLLKLRIDDPLNASPLHGFCGIWGVVAVGLFADQGDLSRAYGLVTEEYGLFLGGNITLLGVQFFGAVTIAIWSFATVALVFLVLRLIGWLNVSMSEEILGMDEVHHGGMAYDFGTRRVDVNLNDKADALKDLEEAFTRDGVMDRAAVVDIFAAHRHNAEEYLGVNTPDELIDKYDMDGNGILDLDELDNLFHDLYLLRQDDHHRSFRRQYGRGGGDDGYVHHNTQPAQPNKTSSAAPSRVAPDPEKGESTGAISSTQASSSDSSSSSS